MGHQSLAGVRRASSRVGGVDHGRMSHTEQYEQGITHRGADRSSEDIKADGSQVSH